jgi:hypothetical protein
MTTLGNDRFHSVIHEIGQNFTVLSHHHRARRHPQNDLSTIGTIAMIALTGLTVTSTTMGTVMELKQRGDIRVDDELYIATMSTITAVRTTEGLEFLAVHRHTAMTAIATSHVEHYSVDEGRHYCDLLSRSS